MKNWKQPLLSLHKELSFVVLMSKAVHSASKYKAAQHLLSLCLYVNLLSALSNAFTLQLNVFIGSTDAAELQSLEILLLGVIGFPGYALQGQQGIVWTSFASWLRGCIQISPWQQLRKCLKGLRSSLVRSVFHCLLQSLCTPVVKVKKHAPSISCRDDRLKKHPPTPQNFTTHNCHI